MKSKIILLLVIAISLTQLVNGQTYSLDWNASFSPAWVAGTTAPTTANNVGTSGVNVTVSFASTAAGTYQNTTPAVGNPGAIGWTLPTPTLTGSMVVWVDWANTNQSVTATISFSTPVANPSFYVGDIDKSAAATTALTDYLDKVTVTGTTPSATTLNATVTKFNAGSTIVLVSGNVANAEPTGGLGGNAPTNAATGAAQDGTVLFTITGTVSSVTIVYSNLNTGGSVNPSGQAINIGDINFTKTVPVSGTIYNDVNGDGVKNGGESGVRPVTLYANIIDVATNTVIGTAAVDASGNFSAPNVASNANIIVQISTTQGTLGGAPPALATITGYANTTPLSNTANTGTAGLANQFFGIERTPESAVNVQNFAVNPGGTINTTVQPAWFVNSTNSGLNPNTQDYDGGTVNNIRITAFPGNATSITINGTLYTSGTWPGGGVTIPYTTGVGPTQTITVDPVNGAVNVAIPFVAIDNAGKEDPTPGSVTLQYLGILPVKLESFNAVKQGSGVLLNWTVSDELNVNGYDVEYSTDGIHFTAIANVKAVNNRNYNYIHTVPVDGLNYYRLKTNDRNGNFAYSNIAKVNFSKGGTVVFYPNPAKDVLNITVTGNMVNKPATISLYSIEGKLMLIQNVKALSQTESIDVNKMAAGKYVVRVVCGNDIINNSIDIAR